MWVSGWNGIRKKCKIPGHNRLGHTLLKRRGEQQKLRKRKGVCVCVCVCACVVVVVAVVVVRVWDIMSSKIPNCPWGN